MSLRRTRDSQLLRAIQWEDLAAVQQQLDAGADVSETYHLGLTPLHVAAESGQGPIVAALLEAGADASATGKGTSTAGFTPLSWMTHKAEAQVHASRNMERSEGGHTHYIHECRASCSSRAEVVQHLVAAGASVQALPTAQCKAGPLCDAAAAGCTILVSALLAAGAEPASSAPEAADLLRAAASSGRGEVVQQVLGALRSSKAVRLGAPGVLPAAASKALHCATSRGYREVAEVLVAAGADREQQHAEGCTPLHAALTYGYCHLVPLLVTPGNVNLQYGANQNHTGSTPLHVALLFPDTCLVELGDKEEQPWVAATQQAVAALLAAGADLTAKDGMERTPLAAAAAGGKAEVMEVLLKHVLQQYKVEQQAQQQQRQQEQQQERQRVPPPQQQQQQQQQQQGGYMQMMQEAGALALATGIGTWQVFLPLVADVLGEEGVRSLWTGVKQQLRRMEELSGEEGGSWRHDFGPYTPPHILNLVKESWAAAWGDVLAQRSAGITGRLEQLVVRPYQQQQQQAGKQPRLTRELRSLTEGTPAAAAAASDVQYDAGAGDGNRSSRAARAMRWPTPGQIQGGAGDSCHRIFGVEVWMPHDQAARGRDLAAEDSTMSQLEAAAARGDEPGMRAALRQLPDGLWGRSAAAAAAAGAGHWELFMGLLRELVQLGQVPNPQAQGPEGTNNYLPRIGNELDLDLATALPGCDLLLTDWLALRQQRVRDLREAVVAAAEAAAAAAAGAEAAEAIVSAAPCL